MPLAEAPWAVDEEEPHPSEIDRLQAEIKALTDVEQILGASAPTARSTSRRSSSPTKAAAAADSKSEAKPARKRREMSAAEKKGGIGAHDRLLGRTEEEGGQEAPGTWPGRVPVDVTPLIRPTVTARRRLQFGPELAVGAGVDCRLSRFRAEGLRSSPGRGRGDAIR